MSEAPVRDIEVETDAGERTLIHESEGLPGHDRAYFEDQYPDLHLPASFPAGGWWQSRPYEVYEEAAVRARGVLHELLERHGETEDRVAFVSHGGFYRHLMRAILSVPAEALGRFALSNCAVSRIDFTERLLVLGRVVLEGDGTPGTDNTRVEIDDALGLAFRYRTTLAG